MNKRRDVLFGRRPVGNISLLTLLFGMLLILATSSRIDSVAGRGDGQSTEGQSTEGIKTGGRIAPTTGQFVPRPSAEAPSTSRVAETAQTCTVNCSATVPATGLVNSPISFAATVETSGCPTSPTFEWDFGDGSARSTQQNPTFSYPTAGTYQWTVRSSVPSDSLRIDTIAGGFGEGNQAIQATLREVQLLARDPLGRGLYIVDSIGDSSFLRFINTGTIAAQVGGVTVEPGAIRVIAGGGTSLSDNVASTTADLVFPTGLTVSPNGGLVYILNQLDGVLRVINVSAAPINVLATPLPVGQIRTLTSGLNPGVNALAAHPTDGSVVIADATSNINRILRVDTAGSISVYAGAGGGSLTTDPFNPGPATAVKLLLPRAVRFETNGNLLIADTGHLRVIRVDNSGNASLVYQAPTPNPFPSGLAVFGGNVFTANGNQQTVTRVSPSGATVTAGTPGSACTYSSDTCGDGGPASLAGLYLASSTASVPLAAIDADATGLFVADQGSAKRARIRYINLSGTAVKVAGVTIPAGAINTIAGTGLDYPYDRGLATSATFSAPTGTAVDASGNLWIADTLASLLRFVNRGKTPVTLFAGTPSEVTVAPGVIVTINSERTGGQVNGPVKNATFADPQGLFITSQGIYVVDSKAGPAVPPLTSGSRRTSFVRFINTSSSPVTFYASSADPVVIQPGSIARIIGGGEGSRGDGGPALSAVLVGASDLVVSANGTIFVTDVGQRLVRRVLPTTGIISSLSIAAAQYTGLGLDSTGRLYIANYENSQLLRETAASSGSFTVLASGLTRARDVAVNASGTAFVTVSPAARLTGNHQIVQVSATGTATVIAGGNPGFAGDGGPASAAQIRISPSELVVGTGTVNQLPETVGIVIGQNNEVIFTDTNNNRIRALSASAITCERSGTISISGSNPVPQIASLAPASAVQNSGAFTLTVNGTNFISGSEVRWNGTARPTTFVSSTQLTASISATDLASTGTVSVTVTNPAPGGGTSPASNFTITAPNPLPLLISLSPATVVQGGAAFTLTVNGNGFVNGAIVRWDGQNRTTTLVSPTQLTAQINAGDIAGAGTAAVTVVNPTPGGGISNALNVTITSPNNPAPTISSLSPSSVNVGAASFTLTVTGGNFIAGSQVEVNGAQRVTTYVSPTQLTATILAADVATAGILQVGVRTPAPGGGVTTTLPLNVNRPAPVLASLNPSVVIAGGPAFTLTVTGSGFLSGVTAQVNGVGRAATFVSATQLTIGLTTADIAAAGSLSIAVANPFSLLSNTLTLPVYNRVTTVSAASYATGDQSPNSLLAAFGLSLAPGVEINTATTLPTQLLGTWVVVRDSAGTSRRQSLFFVAPQQINFHLHPDTAPGPATVTVFVDNNIVALGDLQVGQLAPAIFTQNATGDGVPAAYALRYRGSDYTVVPMLTYDTTMAKWIPVPIDLGQEGEVVYLVLFGTGLRNRSTLGAVTTTIGGRNIPVLYAGPQGTFVGLDQMNLEIPRSLVGAGLVNLQVTVDGKVANPSKQIQLSFK